MKNSIKNVLFHISPRLLVSIQYLYHFKKVLKWWKPLDLNEKINWLKYYSDTSLWTFCADKYRVREFVKQKGLEDILVKLYGKWDHVEDIDWLSLPNSFVLKTNNGSGDVLVCEDKSKLNIEQTKNKYSTLMFNSFSCTNGESHYFSIKPCIIVEEILDSKKQSIKTKTLIDYKIWCFNGKPYYIWTCYNRHKDSVEVATYDLNWVRHDEYSVFTSHYKKAKMDLPKPKCLDRMLEIACVLSEGIPQVRIDLYEVDEKPFFGEMTFTSAGGFMNYFTPDFLREMGNLVDLSLVKRKK